MLQATAPQYVLHFVSESVLHNTCFHVQHSTAVVPGRPTNVQGTVQSPQSVQLSWLPPSSNYQHVIGYRVSYNNQEMNTTLRSLTINGLTGTMYTFYVRASSLAGWSSSSSTTVTIGKLETPSSKA